MSEAITIEDFVGEYTVRQGSANPNASPEPVLDVDDKVYIGTGNHDDSIPHEDNGQQKVGISHVKQGNTVPSFTVEASFDMRTLTLGWQSQASGRRYQVSLFIWENAPCGDNLYKCVYGVSIDDPQEVGAWGADDN